MWNLAADVWALLWWGESSGLASGCLDRLSAAGIKPFQFHTCPRHGAAGGTLDLRAGWSSVEQPWAPGEGDALH